MSVQMGGVKGGVNLIPENEVAMRIEAMATEYRAMIAAQADRAAMLAVANALANQKIAEQAKEIEKLKSAPAEASAE